MQHLIEAYHTFFGKAEQFYKLFAPYRICPLGAHVDHQHGLVTGFAFDKGIKFLFTPTESGKVEMCSLTFEGLMTFNVQKPVDEKQQNWGDYLRGATWALQQDYRLKRGVRGVVEGSMPIGGLSSSAALLCGFVMALSKVNDLHLDKMQVFHYASLAEREYIGLKNGILDQACVVLCEEGKLLYLDTATSKYELLPFGDGKQELPFELGIFFSGVTRQLIGTDYNLRVSECKTAAWMVNAYENQPLKTLEETYLRDTDKTSFVRHSRQMPERFARRAQHFYSECERVEQGVEAWKQGDIEAFGRLVFESCESSIHNYECGSPELTAMYEIMKETDGIYGGRFSGAGFKGACIALIDSKKKEAVKQQVTEAYLSRFPQYSEGFLVSFCKTSDGAGFIE